MSLTHHIKPMKLFTAIASAAVIGASFLVPNPVEAKIMTGPCKDGGGSGGWMFEANSIPDHHFPVVILSVSQMKPGQYSEHPMYDAPREWDRYGYCAISTSAD